jgi:hypothetical protein
MSAPAIATPRERPILFSGVMVNAILAGRKTQTRRLVTQATERTTRIYFARNTETVPPGKYTGWVHECDAPLGLPITCPFGAPGDRLWVRETWHPCDSGPVIYAADYGHSKSFAGVERWSPAIHMKRSDARLLLEIVELRVERLQAITNLDAIAEGIDDAPKGAAPGHFADLWDGINGKRAPWSSSPWVWVVSFKRVEQSNAP